MLLEPRDNFNNRARREIKPPACMPPYIPPKVELTPVVIMFPAEKA
jgi:hypothetical protein